MPDIVTLDTLYVEIKNTKELLSEARDDIKEIKDTVNKDYVTKEELKLCIEKIHEKYKPIERVVYTIVTVIGVAVLGAIAALLLKGG
jgi:esterase/lipase